MFLFGQEAGGAAGAAGSNPIMAFIPFILIFVIFYFVIIMPAKKKQKQHQGMVGALQGGERVITNGGIYGTVSRVLEDRIEIEVDKNVKLQVTKPSISAVIAPDGTGTNVK